MYKLTMRDECGGEDTVTFDTRPDSKTCQDHAESWCRDGEWGTDGAEIDVRWKLTKDGEEIDSGRVLVEIEPDHEAKIREASGDNPCGFRPDDHDWTSEGEGGCDENPGVWSTGGTGLVFHSHCRDCGLKRVEHHRGSQKNPGETDTVEYSYE